MTGLHVPKLLGDVGLQSPFSLSLGLAPELSVFKHAALTLSLTSHWAVFSDHSHQL